MPTISRNPAASTNATIEGSKRFSGLDWLKFVSRGWSSARTLPALAMIAPLAMATCSREPAWEFSIESALEIVDSLESKDPRVTLSENPDECRSVPDSGSATVATGVSQYVASYLTREDLGFKCAARLVTHATERSGTISIDEATELVAWHNGNDPAGGTVFARLFYEQRADDTANLETLWPVAVGLEGLRSVLESADTTTDIVITVSDISLWSAPDPSSLTDSAQTSEHDPYFTNLGVSGDDGPVLPATLVSAPGWMLRSSPYPIGDGASFLFGRHEPPTATTMATEATVPTAGAGIDYLPVSSPFLASDFQPIALVNDSALLKRGTDFARELGAAVQARPVTYASTLNKSILMSVIQTLLPFILLGLAIRATADAARGRRNRIQGELKTIQGFPPRDDPHGPKESLFNYSKSHESIHLWAARIEETAGKLTGAESSLAQTIDDATEARRPDTLLANLKELERLVIPPSVEPPTTDGRLPDPVRLPWAPKWIRRPLAWILVTFGRSPQNASSDGDPNGITEQQEGILSSINEGRGRIEDWEQAAQKLSVLVASQSVNTQLRTLTMLASRLHKSLAKTDELTEKVATWWIEAKGPLGQFVRGYAAGEMAESELEDIRRKSIEVNKKLDKVQSLLPSDLDEDVNRVFKAIDALDKIVQTATQYLNDLSQWAHIYDGLGNLEEAIRRLNRAGTFGEAAGLKEKIETTCKMLRNSMDAGRGEADDLVTVRNAVGVIRGAIPNHNERQHLEQLGGKIEAAMQAIKEADGRIDAEFKKACRQAFLKMRKQKLEDAMRKKVDRILQGTPQRLGQIVIRKGSVIPVLVGVVATTMTAVAGWQLLGAGKQVPALIVLAATFAALLLVGRCVAFSGGKWIAKSKGLPEHGSRIQTRRRSMQLWFVGGCGLVTYGALKSFERAGSAAGLDGIGFHGTIEMFSMFATVLAACSVRDGVQWEPEGRNTTLCLECDDETERDRWKACGGDACELCGCGNRCVRCLENEAMEGEPPSKGNGRTLWSFLALVYMLAVALFVWCGWLASVGVGSGTGWSEFELEVIKLVAPGVLLVPLGFVVDVLLRGQGTTVNTKRRPGPPELEAGQSDAGSRSRGS